MPVTGKHTGLLSSLLEEPLNVPLSGARRTIRFVDEHSMLVNPSTLMEYRYVMF